MANQQDPKPPHSITGLGIRNSISKALDSSLPEPGDSRPVETSYQRGIGHTALGVAAPPPTPLLVVGAQISHFTDTGDITWYHIILFSNQGKQWTTRARFSAFSELREVFEHAPLNIGFPAKMPLRAWLGLADERKEERRAALELWLNAAVSLSVRQCPWMRAPLYAFFHIKSHFLRAPVTASPSAQQRQRSTSGASSPPSREVTVQMPPTSVGSLLEIEVNGQTFVFYAPGHVSEANEPFTVTLPPEKGVDAYDEMVGSSHGPDIGAMPVIPSTTATSGSSYSANARSSGDDSNPFGRPSGNYENFQSHLTRE